MSKKIKSDFIKDDVSRIEIEDTSHCNELADIVPNNNLEEPKLFKFIERFCDLIYEHCSSSHKQIIAILVFDIANIIAIAGIKYTAHYLFDFSESGSGKDTSADLSRELVLKPIQRIQEGLRSSHYEKKLDDKEFKGKIFSSIHGAEITTQSISKAFENNKHQCIRLSEVGQLLKDPKNQVVNFIVSNYGKPTIDLPMYIKDLNVDKPAFIEDASLSFYGNSNLAYLGHKTFSQHMKGGLLNRCILLFEDYARPFEDLPKVREIANKELRSAQMKSNAFYIYCKNASKYVIPPIRQTDKYIKFHREIYDKQLELKGTPAQEIHKRTIQNFRAIIYTFHFIECFEKDVDQDPNNIYSLNDYETVFTDQDGNEIKPTSKYNHISDEVITMAVEYMKWLISGYDKLIAEVVGVSDDIKKEDLAENIANFIKKDFEIKRKSGKVATIKTREICRKFNINKTTLNELLEGRISIKKSNIEGVI